MILDGVIGGVGQFLDEAVTAMTGSEVLGDAVGLVANMATGNYIGAVKEGMELLDDLKAEGGPGEMLEEATYELQHPAQSCPARASGKHSVEVEVQVSRSEGQVPTSRQSVVAESAAREAAAELESRVENLPAVDIDVSVRPGEAGGSGVEVDVDVDVSVGWGEIPEAAPEVRDSLAAKLRDILGDTSLSLEDKIALLFSELLDGLDGEIEGKMDSLQEKQAAKERAESGAKGKPVRGGEEPSAADISRMSSELQILMQRRSQMQSLLSNIMGMSHQASMQTIANIR